MRLDAGPEVTAREFVAGLRLGGLIDGRAGPRPRVAAVMIASVDGRATIDGRSVKLGHPDDRALLREMRAQADAVLVGPGTIKAEKYATLLDDDQVAWRRAAGMSPHPVVATVTRSLSLRAGDAPIFSEPGVPVAVYTETAGSVGAAAVHVLEHADFPSVLAHLASAYGVRSISCEGGPTLLRALALDGCLDELLMTVAPLLVAGDGPAPLAGDVLDPPLPMTLTAVHQADSHLFLRYRA